MDLELGAQIPGCVWDADFVGGFAGWHGIGPAAANFILPCKVSLLFSWPGLLCLVFLRWSSLPGAQLAV